MAQYTNGRDRDLEPRVAVLENERDHLTSDLQELKQEVRDGFRSIHARLDGMTRPASPSAVASVVDRLGANWKSITVWLVVIVGGSSVAHRLVDAVIKLVAS